MLKRDFLNLLVKATATLVAPTPALASSVFPKVNDLFPQDLLDSFLDYKLVRSLRLGEKETSEHPYQGLEKASKHIKDLLECIQNPSPSGYRFVPPNFHFLGLLGNDSLWQNRASGKISLNAWIQFGNVLEQNNISITKLSDQELLKRLPQAFAESKKSTQSCASQDPLLAQIAESFRNRIFDKVDPASGIRKLINFHQELNTETVRNMNQIVQTIKAPPPSLLAKSPDTFALLEHLQESGFSPFPYGSRLAKLQSLAINFRKFQSLQGISDSFLKQKRLAEELCRQSTELGFDLPLQESIHATRYSESYEQFKDRTYSQNRKNTDYHKEFLKHKGFSDQQYLIYRYDPKGTIINLFLPDSSKFAPMHVFFSPLINKIFADIIWENLNSEQLLSSETQLLRLSRTPTSISVKAIEIDQLLI